jgi:small GTP-binding protein
MGLFFSKIWDKLLGKKRNVRVIMVGLDSVGKTTILYKLKSNENIKTIPTIGFNIENLEYKGLKISMWDIGGQDNFRPLWKTYYFGTNAVIYVVDSTDRDRIEINYETLHTMFSTQDLESAHLLVYANKQDMPQAMTPQEISEALNLKILSCKWNIVGTLARKGEGLSDGLDWIAKTLLEEK